MADQFVALDVETANPHPGSICSVGCARFERGAVVDEHYVLINPDQYFAGQQVGIHGISEDDVAGAPLFPDALDDLHRFIDRAPVLHHTHFDLTAVRRACQDWGAEPPRWVWFDSAEAARRTWRQFARKGYGLANLCRHIGYQFQHHHALEDAKAGGYVTPVTSPSPRCASAASPHSTSCAPISISRPAALRRPEVQRALLKAK